MKIESATIAKLLLGALQEAENVHSFTELLGIVRCVASGLKAELMQSKEFVELINPENKS